MMIMLPFWTLVLIRVYAWTGILTDQGLLNNALLELGLVDEPARRSTQQFAMLSA